MSQTVCDPAALARRLGFPEASGSHLLEALTHRTYAVEHALNYDNQRLEFLGDAVLEIIQTEYLFRLYPEAPEGDLTKMRAALACEASLGAWARRLGLGSYLRIGRGERDSGGAERESTLADLFEAILGALYLDCGMAAARQFVLELLEADNIDPARRLADANPKGKLQEFSQRRWGVTPEYKMLRISGPRHRPFYEIEARLKKYTAVGHGSSRKAAESMAAERLVRYLTGE